MTNKLLENLVTISNSDPSLDQQNIKNKIKIILYNHQLETLQKMIDIETGKNRQNKDNIFHSGFGILADPVGSGKTLEMLSLISICPKLNPINSVNITGSNKRIVISDRIIYEIYIPYKHNSEFTFNNQLTSRIYGNNTYLSSISRVFKGLGIINPSIWKFQLIPTNIIVVPHNVISHWKMTVSKFTDLKYKIISKTVDIPKHMNDLNNFEVVIISSPRLKDFIEMYIKNMFDDNTHYYVYRYIVDEAHTYKARFMYYWKDKFLRFGGTFKINSIFVWWISSSFASLFSYNSPVNPFTPLTNIFNDTGTKIISKLTIKHSQDDIINSIKLPPKYYYKIYAELSQMWQVVISNFKNVLTTEALAAINANDYDEAIQRLGIESIKPEKLLDAMTQKLQYEIDNLKIMLRAKKKMKYTSDNYKKKALGKLAEDIEVKEHNLKKITNSIQNGEDCPICFCELDEVKALLQCCYKKTCLECLVTYFTQKYECPCCAKVSPKYIAIGENIGNNSNKKDNENNENKITEINSKLSLSSESKKELLKLVSTKDKLKSSKYINLMDNILNSKEKQFENVCSFLCYCTIKPSILVFSSYDGTFHVCKNILTKLEMGCKEIKGTPDHINKIVERYNTRDLSCLLLNSKHMGFGMNLQMTTDIIIMHKMETEMENQVIGRAYRIGKTTPLRIWYIYHQNEED